MPKALNCKSCTFDVGQIVVNHEGRKGKKEKCLEGREDLLYLGYGLELRTGLGRRC